MISTHNMTWEDHLQHFPICDEIDGSELKAQSQQV
jgi:hypothetical protein